MPAKQPTTLHASLLQLAGCSSCTTIRWASNTTISRHHMHAVIVCLVLQQHPHQRPQGFWPRLLASNAGSWQDSTGHQHCSWWEQQPKPAAAVPQQRNPAVTRVNCRFVPVYQHPPSRQSLEATRPEGCSFNIACPPASVEHGPNCQHSKLGSAQQRTPPYTTSQQPMLGCKAAASKATPTPVYDKHPQVQQHRPLGLQGQLRHLYYSNESSNLQWTPAAGQMQPTAQECT
jgi:hypothetical protein